MGDGGDGVAGSQPELPPRSVGFCLHVMGDGQVASPRRESTTHLVPDTEPG